MELKMNATDTQRIYRKQSSQGNNWLGIKIFYKFP